MKTCGMALEHHIFLTTTLDKGQWSAAYFHSFTLTKDSKDVQCTIGGMVPKYDQETVVAERNSLTLPGIELTPHPVTD